MCKKYNSSSFSYYQSARQYILECHLIFRWHNVLAFIFLLHCLTFKFLNFMPSKPFYYDATAPVIYIMYYNTISSLYATIEMDESNTINRWNNNYFYKREWMNYVCIFIAYNCLIVCAFACFLGDFKNVFDILVRECKL